MDNAISRLARIFSRAKPILSWFGLLGLFTLMCWGINLNAVLLHLDLVRHGAQTTGVVIQKLPQDHYTVLYNYEVDGHLYSGQTQPNSPNPEEMGQIRIGGKLVVFYNAKNPVYSAISDLNNLLNNDIAGGLGGGIFCSVVGMFFRWMLKQQDKSRAALA